MLRRPLTRKPIRHSCELLAATRYYYTMVFDVSRTGGSTSLAAIFDRETFLYSIIAVYSQSKLHRLVVLSICVSVEKLKTEGRV